MSGPPPPGTPWALTLAADEMAPFDDLFPSSLPVANDPRFREHTGTVEWIPSREGDIKTSENPSAAAAPDRPIYTPTTPPGRPPDIFEWPERPPALPTTIPPDLELDCGTALPMEATGGVGAASSPSSMIYTPTTPPGRPPDVVESFDRDEEPSTSNSIGPVVSGGAASVAIGEELYAPSPTSRTGMNYNDEMNFEEVFRYNENPMGTTPVLTRVPPQGLTPPKAGMPGSIANMTIPELITPTDGRRDKKGAVGIIPRMTLPTFARPNGGRVVYSPNTASSTGDGIKRQVTTRIFTFEGVPDPQAASSLLNNSQPPCDSDGKLNDTSNETLGAIGPLPWNEAEINQHLLTLDIPDVLLPPPQTGASNTAPATGARGPTARVVALAAQKLDSTSNPLTGGEAAKVTTAALAAAAAVAAFEAKNATTIPKGNKRLGRPPKGISTAGSKKKSAALVQKNVKPDAVTHNSQMKRKKTLEKLPPPPVNSAALAAAKSAAASSVALATAAAARAAATAAVGASSKLGIPAEGAKVTLKGSAQSKVRHETTRERSTGTSEFDIYSRNDRSTTAKLRRKAFLELATADVDRVKKERDFIDTQIRFNHAQAESYLVYCEWRRIFDKRECTAPHACRVFYKEELATQKHNKAYRERRAAEAGVKEAETCATLAQARMREAAEAFDLKTAAKVTAEAALHAFDNQMTSRTTEAPSEKSSGDCKRRRDDDSGGWEGSAVASDDSNDGDAGAGRRRRVRSVLTESEETEAASKGVEAERVIRDQVESQAATIAAERRGALVFAVEAAVAELAESERVVKDAAIAAGQAADEIVAATQAFDLPGAVRAHNRAIREHRSRWEEAKPIVGQVNADVNYQHHLCVWSAQLVQRASIAWDTREAARVALNAAGLRLAQASRVLKGFPGAEKLDMSRHTLFKTLVEHARQMAEGQADGDVCTGGSCGIESGIGGVSKNKIGSGGSQDTPVALTFSGIGGQGGDTSVVATDGNTTNASSSDSASASGSGEYSNINNNSNSNSSSRV